MGKESMVWNPGELRIENRPRNFQGDKSKGIRYHVQVKADTEQGKLALAKQALRYTNVDLGGKLPVFNGKTEDEMTEQEFMALNGTTVVVDYDDEAISSIVLEKADRAARTVTPEEIVATSLREALVAAGKDKDSEDVKKYTAALVRQIMADPNDPRHAKVASKVAAVQKALDAQKKAQDLSEF